MRLLGTFIISLTFRPSRCLQSHNAPQFQLSNSVTPRRQTSSERIRSYYLLFYMIYYRLFALSNSFATSLTDGEC